jgi:hypothetical protein
MQRERELWSSKRSTHGYFRINPWLVWKKRAHSFSATITENPRPQLHEREALRPDFARSLQALLITELPSSEKKIPAVRCGRKRNIDPCAI